MNAVLEGSYETSMIGIWIKMGWRMRVDGVMLLWKPRTSFLLACYSILGALALGLKFPYSKPCFELTYYSACTLIYMVVFLKIIHHHQRVILSSLDLLF